MDRSCPTDKGYGGWGGRTSNFEVEVEAEVEGTSNDVEVKFDVGEGNWIADVEGEVQRSKEGIITYIRLRFYADTRDLFVLQRELP